MVYIGNVLLAGRLPGALDLPFWKALMGLSQTVVSHSHLRVENATDVYARPKFAYNLAPRGYLALNLGT